MSNIYNLEPATKGKVLLYTSHGDVEIELWAREAPKACRNFVQLCLEGYYDNVIFHRLVKGFCIQGGDPTGTGTGGESIYGEEFKDEFHQRLQFNRRGLVAMANSGQPNTNTSQFFVTLGDAPELQKKHTIFGKVAGNTIYNVLRMAELDTDNEDRPLEPPCIKKTEILNNPFDDITVRDIRHKPDETKSDKKKKKKSQMKATKNFKLLSFGDEAEEDEEQVDQATSKIGKIASAHDAVSDPKLSAQVAVSDAQLQQDREKIKTQAAEIRNKLKKELDIKPDTTPLTSAKQAKLSSLKEESALLLNHIKGIGKEEKMDQMKEAEKDEHLNPAEKETITSFRKDLREYKTLQNTKNQKSKSEREKQTMGFLQEFTAKLKQGKAATEVEIKEDMEEEEEEEFLNNSNLFSHSLVAADSKTKVKDANIEDDDTYEIYDPRHPINKRKREKDKKKPDEKWKRTKILA